MRHGKERKTESTAARETTGGVHYQEAACKFEVSNLAGHLRCGGNVPFDVRSGTRISLRAFAGR